MLSDITTTDEEKPKPDKKQKRQQPEKNDYIKFNAYYQQTMDSESTKPKEKKWTQELNRKKLGGFQMERC